MPTARACNLTLDGSPPPDWIELLPAGPAIQGVDGRAWTLPDPTALITAFASRNAPLVIDWEHASEHRASQGLDAPAAGWIDRLEARDGAIWGHVEWTPKAVQQIADREYRFLSPVFAYTKADARIVQIISAGLTNQPNLPLTALNREESPVSLPAELCAALELPDTASEAVALARIQTLNLALNTAQALAAAPPLDKFIPRADYDAALARASNAETRVKELETGQRNQAIEAALNGALQAGQICPATVEFYRAGCQREGGMEAFNQFLKAAPPILGAKPDLDGQKPPTALNRAAFEALSPVARADYLKTGARIVD
ncbi:MAG: phage protease [Candidatus Contendobacter sp.]|jgi:phage I-like protein|nr:phage protease [Candidatus Contendobacter sp.]